MTPWHFPCLSAFALCYYLDPSPPWSKKFDPICVGYNLHIWYSPCHLLLTYVKGQKDSKCFAPFSSKKYVGVFLLFSVQIKHSDFPSSSQAGKSNMVCISHCKSWGVPFRLLIQFSAFLDPQIPSKNHVQHISKMWICWMSTSSTGTGFKRIMPILC